MLILGIILIAVALIGTLIYIRNSEEDYSLLVLFLIIVMFWGTTFLMENVQEKETAIECLKDNNPYRMEIRYELQDSVYVPIDTVYIKK